MAIDSRYRMSQERLDTLKEELHYLETTREKEVAELIKEARSFGDLSENSEAVIYGEVLSVKYIVGENGLCRTNLEVKVLQSLKGDFHTGDTVKVAKDQGITSIKDYIDSFADEEMKEVNREDFSEYSDDELEKLYIEQIGENDIMSEVGQKSILFLVGIVYTKRTKI